MPITKASGNSVTAAAKGDLVVGNATNDSGILSVGANGETLVADSSTSTGLRWTGANQQNPVLNSSYDIWQRGTSIASGAAAPYTADRWQIGRSGSVAGITVSRQATGDSTNLPNIQYCARVQRDSGNTSTAQIYFMQSFETANSIPFAGKTVTLSFYARSGANFSAASSLMFARIDTGTGTDQNVFTGYAGPATPVNESRTITTTWQRFSVTGSLGSTTNELGLLFGFTPVGTAGAADYFEITGVQLDIGSVALPYRRNSATLQAELAACQRYYWRNTSTTSTNFGWFGMMGTGASTTSISGFINYPVRMRTVPTSIDFQGISWITAWGAGVTGITAATINTTGTTDNSAIITLTTTGTTAGTLYYILSNNGNHFIGLSAEL